MNMKYKIMAGAIILILTFLVIVEGLKPEPLNWYPSYSKHDKIPFGTYIFYDQLMQKMGAKNYQEVSIPPYEFLQEDSESGTYLFINNSVYFDKAEVKKILSWVAKGNTLYVAASSQSKELLDTLNLSTKVLYDLDETIKRPLVNLSNPTLKSQTPYQLDKDWATVYFDQINTTNATVLGITDIIRGQDSTQIKEPKINFLKIPFQKGTIILNTFPEGFTNFFMLTRDNATYTSNALAYLPKEDKLYVDQHYKSGKTYYSSPLYLLFYNKYLKWAYYLLLFGALLWVLFEGKRKQRSIPVLKPVQNQSLAFTKTIAGMYLDKKEHTQIAQHQINHFMEYLRSSYQLQTANQGPEFIHDLAAKSGIPQEEVKKVIDYIIFCKQQDRLSEAQLIELNSLIENFKNQEA